MSQSRIRIPTWLKARAEQSPHPRLNSPLKTKLQRNPHLSVLPKLIFNPSRAVEAAESVGELNESPQVAAAKIRNDQAAMFLHLKFAHMSMDDIRKLKQKGHLKDCPVKIPDLPYPCPLCKICSATRIPRGQLVDTTELRKGVRLHADFAIFNSESCRGFKSALIFVEATTRVKFGFPTRSRSKRQPA